MDYSREDLKVADGSGNLILRRACVFNAGEILALINSYASSNLMLPRSPKYFYENIRDFVVVKVVGEGAEAKIVSCGSLPVLWEDIAEVHALAVHPQFWRRGLGSKIVRYLIEEAGRWELRRCLPLLWRRSFLRSLVLNQRQSPKYFQCDETGLIFDCTE